MGNTTSARSLKAGITMHRKCRSTFYPRGDNIQRAPVPDDKVFWDVSWPTYNPVPYTSDSVKKKPVWADPELTVEPDMTIAWNNLDGKVDRRSHLRNYELVNNLPRNPVGRTGIWMRGTLGRWGPNHAADPVVTRWKRDENGAIMKNSDSGKPILQFIAIQRRDSGEWAIPGGMVDAGEAVSLTLKREFSEEALNALEASPEERHRIEEAITDLFHKGEEVYRGYVDDPRNTDNSWMETIAVNFHDETGQSVGRVKLHAGDDAVGVQWSDINRKLKLFASHSDFIKTVAQRRNADW